MTRIRTLLLAAGAASAMALGAGSASAQSIAEVLAATGNHETLLAAVEAAGMTERLLGEEPYTYEYTVFAPTDEAFAALPAGTVETLLLPENRRELQRVLKNHILPGLITLTDYYATRGDRITFNYDFMTINGHMVEFNADGVTPTEFDIGASNGVIHIVDAVLVP